MKTAEIRKAFLEYFSERKHQIVESASLVPQGDPTLLFVNAGMVPFKDCFLGLEKRPYTRATSCQKSLRISGKHNDLENVGRTARHHTFFEMLGNFSFGDYFKEDAIKYAWEFLSDELKLDKSKLWVTVYEEDDEAAELWKKLTDVKPERVLRCGEKDNFWAMGDTGPCGPCSEVFYYLGDDPKNQSEEEFRKDDGTYIEIWNLVFMQFNRDASGALEPLPKPSVDTGMGLERIAAVKQNVKSNYDIDLFREIISFSEKLSGKNYSGADYTERNILEDEQYATDVSLRVIADHVRSASFLIADGISPSSEGRGYVLRRLIRRASRYGRIIEIKEAFLFKVAEKLVSLMEEAYPELKANSKKISKAIKQEEEKFLQTLDTGTAVLDKKLKELEKTANKVFPGETAFQLHDTYGFPLDMTADILLTHGLSVDEDGFHLAMAEQKERSRTARASKSELILRKSVKSLDTEFKGYDFLEYESKVAGLFSEDGEVKVAKAGDSIALVSTETPFYGESGGQIGDTGSISANGFSAKVIDTQKVQGQTLAHICEVTEGEISKGEEIRLTVDAKRRGSICLAHSATHILHFALREVLGEHVKQAGSRVAEENLRFDFSHDEPITEEQLLRIQELANNELRLNHEVQITNMKLDDAKKKGAMALFGEKYGEVVRVVEIGPRSLELCGGTHVKRSADIGLISLVGTTSISQGVRRLEALVSGLATKEHGRLQFLSNSLSRLVNSSSEDVLSRVEKLVERNKLNEQKLEKLGAQVNLAKGGDILSQAETNQAGIKIIATKLDSLPPKQLREVADDLRNRMGSGCLALATVNDGKVALLTAVTKDLTKKYNAGSLIKEMAKVLGSKGGGKPDLAQAGGGDPGKLDQALEMFKEMVQ